MSECETYMLESLSKALLLQLTITRITSAINMADRTHSPRPIGSVSAISETNVHDDKHPKGTIHGPFFQISVLVSDSTRSQPPPPRSTLPQKRPHTRTLVRRNASRKSNGRSRAREQPRRERRGERVLGETPEARCRGNTLHARCWRNTPSW
jgi:hypothetical protein